MTKMISVQLVGGLGNQLFGYFAGRYLELQLRYKVRYDTSQFDKGITAHGSSIQKLNLPGEFFRLEPVTSFPILLLQRLCLGLAYKFPSMSKALELITGIHTAAEVGFDPELTRVRSGMLVRGYFQSYKYASAVLSDESHIVEPISPSSWYTSMSAVALATQPVMVHIRRGDYAKPENSNFGMLAVEYYLDALERLRSLGLEDSPIWIFSDELDAVRMEFGERLGSAQLIYPDPEASAEETMLLMSKGVANIISNSTFSWWSAMLGAPRFVIAPDNWFKAMADPNDLIPPNWLRQESIWK